MKKIQFAPLLILIGLMVALNFGCKKNEAPSASQNPTTSEKKSAPGAQTNSPIVSAEKTVSPK